MAEVQFFAVAPTHVIATWRGLQLAWWRNAVTPESLAACMRSHDALVRADPTGFVSLSVVEASVGIPDATIRETAAQLMRVTAPHLRATGIAVIGGGFWASAARSAATGFALFSGMTRGLRMFSTTEDLVAWGAPLGDQRPSELASAFDELARAVLAGKA